MDFDAILRHWTFEDGRLRGVCYNDKQGRFQDGEAVVTSTVITISNGIAQTRNTRYLLILGGV